MSLNTCDRCGSIQDWATEMYWQGEQDEETNIILGDHTAVCDDCFATLKLQVANAKALAKHQKFQEELQEQQTKDIEEMDRLGLDHPFKTKKRIEDDDYQDRGLHRSDFIDDKYI